MKLDSLHTIGGSDTGGSASQPTLSVAGRVDGEAYTVTAGARSLSISAQAGATLLTTVEQASTGAAVAVTGSTTTTPSWTTPTGGTTGDAVNVLTVATLAGLTSQVGYTERTAGTPAGGWTTPADYDYTSDNDTSVTITPGGGGTTLYEADGTTPKGTVNAQNRAGSPTSSATVVADGIDLQAVRVGASNAFICNWVMTSSDVDFTDPAGIFALDVVVKDIVLAADDDQINIALGNDDDPFVDDAFVLQIRRVSGATQYRRRRVDAGTSTDTAFTSGTAISSIAIRWIVFRGRVISMLYQLNATAPIAVVEASGSVVESWKGGSLGILEGTVEQITSPFYIGVDLGPRGTSGQVDCTVTHIQASSLDIAP